ncbi:MAG: ABC transporter substrate-binding protein [Roseococcus sp.]|nr:ABC transporter substrate-binding protein [Roseococcus sp.]
MPITHGRRGLLAAPVLLAAPAAAQQRSLTIVNNGGAVAEASRRAWYEPFARERGVRIVEDSWSQEFARLRTQVETRQIRWDVVEITFNNMAVGCDEGLLERVDWSRHFDIQPFAAAGGVSDCAVPIMSVVGGLAYDADKLGNDPPRSWADFWNVRRWPGRRGLLFRPSMVEIALMADGVPPREVLDVLSAPGGVDRAFRKLDELKPHIHWWRAGAESVQILASGEVSMVYAWNGRIAVANQQDRRNLRIAFEAGFILGNQYLAIMRGSRNRDLAIEFITHAASAAPLAAFSRQMQYGPPNAAALPLLDDRFRAMLPPENMMHLAYLQQGERYQRFWLDNLDGLTQRLARWAAG